MILEILSGLMFLFGLFFLVVGVVGIIRLPDAYSRLHASGKVATVGLFGILIGGGLLEPQLMPRLLLLALFFLLTAPAASHIIAVGDQAQRERHAKAEPAVEQPASAD